MEPNEGSDECQGKGTAVDIVSITVNSGATQTNVITFANDWATVCNGSAKNPGTALVQVKLKPDTDDAAKAVTWTGGDAVSGQPRQRSVNVFNSAKTNVKATVGAKFKDLNVWAIWASVTIAMGVGDTISKDNAATATAINAGPTFSAEFGGGNKLGPIDRGAVPGLAIRYAIGKIEARAILTPTGIGDIIDSTVWDFKRSVTARSWDNAGHYEGATWKAGPQADYTNKDDTSYAIWKDVDPSSLFHLDKLYDLDGPGCSMKLDPPIHNSEVYANFSQWVTVDLGAGPTACSNWQDGSWSYVAQLDLDKAGANKMDANALSTTSVIIPDNPKYTKQ